MSQTPIQRATQLREQLERAAEAYYNRDEQLIPDAEYDALLRELEALEAEHPQLKAEDSISGRIGGRASTSRSSAARSASARKAAATRKRRARHRASA